MLTGKISDYIKRAGKDGLWSVISFGIVLLGYKNLNGEPIEPTYRDLDIKTEILESGLEATIVSTMKTWTWEDVSLVLDDENSPLILYKNTDELLELADVNDGQWRARTLTSRISGGWNSMAFDNEGYLIISSSAGDGSNEDLFFLTERDGFIPHRVYDGLSVGLENCIATDSQNNTYIVHWQWNGRNLLLTTDKDGDWRTIILDYPVYSTGSWYRISMVVDSADKMKISYSWDIVGTLDLRTLDDLTREWKEEKIPNVDIINQIVIDANDVLSLVSSGNNKYGELTVLSSDEGWFPNVIGEETSTFMNHKHYYDSSIAIDSKGKKHIAVIAGESDPIYNGSLLYLTNLSGEWQEFLVDRGIRLHTPAIAVDNKDEIHVAYSQDVEELIGAPGQLIKYVKYVTFNPLELSLPLKLITGLGFGPYRVGQDPILGPNPTIDEITEDLSFVAGLTPYIRTYGIDDNLSVIPELCYDKGLSCFVGIRLSNDILLNEQEIEDLLTLVRNGHHSLYGIIVGNNTIFKGDLTNEQIVDYINDIKSRIRNDSTINPEPKYIMTAENWSSWLNNIPLTIASDLIIANIYPYLEGINIENAAVYTVDIYKTMAAPTRKQIVVSTGWPSAGEIIGEAVPSEENQKKFLLEFMDLAKQNNIPYFIHEAFDEPWRAQYEGQAGAHWGLVDPNGVMKDSLISIIPTSTSSLKATQ